MKLQLPIRIPPLSQPIGYKDRILLTGSCFTEHIADRLSLHKFATLQNPNGILFNPLSVADSLSGYAMKRQYGPESLFYEGELWGSWDHHTRFSNMDKDAALADINAAQSTASVFVKEANWIIITLGSAFQYYLKAGNRPVANNHRAPAAWFEKRLLSVDAIIGALNATMNTVRRVNPDVQFLFTISPVRHIRDGVVENNRSKARLIEAVHTLVAEAPRCHYFPAYELVIDVLRDYRYYDIDLVHPNYAATEAVWEAFAEACLAPEACPVMEQVADIVTAMAHRPRFPQTQGHRKFLQSYAAKVAALATAHPELNLAAEAAYFNV